MLEFFSFNQTFPGDLLRVLLPVLVPVSATLSASPSEAWANVTQEVQPSERPGFALETFKTHSRISVRVDEGVMTRWESGPSGFTLRLSGIGIADLGPEEELKKRFASITDPRIYSIKFIETVDGLTIEGRWRYPSGDLALANPRMESFSYRDSGTSSLGYVVDFWHRRGPTLAEVKAVQSRKKQLEDKQKDESESREKANRRIAAMQQREQAQKLVNFCDQGLREDSDVFLPFYPYHEPVRYSRWIHATSPDHDFVYFEPNSKERDAQYVRFALDLYRQGKPALVIRTLDFLEAEFPRSQFRTEMLFLRANAMIRLGLHREADIALERLLLEAKESPPALHAGMYLAAKRATEGSHLKALELFLWLAKRHSGHRLHWLFHLGAAEANAGLKQQNEAAKEYQWVVEKASDRMIQADAAVRIGDLYQMRFQQEQALGAYGTALAHFATEALTYPSWHLNRAEALYQLSQLDRAKESFETFLEKFPTHPSGWRAAYRLAEIADRARDVASAQKRYYETINRYPFSPGATLARLRLIPCGDHAGLGLEAAERFFDEAKGFDGLGEVQTERYERLRTLARFRALISWEQDEKAIEVGIQEILPHFKGEMRENLATTLTVLFKRRVNALFAQGKKIEAVAFFQKKAGYLPQGALDQDPAFLLKLSQEASGLGLGKLGEQLARAVEGRSPSADSIENNKAERNFAQAKALWISSGGAVRRDLEPEVEKKLRIHLEGSTEEAFFAYEKELILGLIEEKKGKYREALQHALKAQLLKSARPKDGPASTDLRLDAWIGGLESQAGDTEVALEVFRSLEQAIQEKITAREPYSDPASVEAVLGVPPCGDLEWAILSQADLLLKRRRFGEAAAAFSRAVDRGLGGGQALYGYARALMLEGKKDSRKNGLRILEELAQGTAKKSADEEIVWAPWRRLAREMLAGEKVGK